jgi:hypothetical protein
MESSGIEKLFGNRVEVFLKGNTWLIKHITVDHAPTVRQSEARATQAEAITHAQELYPGLPVVVVPTHGQ